MLDHVLAALLLAAVPAHALWKSRVTPRGSTPKATRYVTTIWLVATLLALLAVNWHLAGRSIAALGLMLPATTPALIGLGVACALLALLALIPGRADARTTDTQDAASELLPDTAREMRLFVLFAIVLGFGWEVLYRGFLLFYLTPHVGIAAAVCLAAIAYGVGHGCRSGRQLAGSMAGALAFTLGYAVTGNLWWLILLHIGLPLLALAARRKAG